MLPALKPVSAGRVDRGSAGALPVASGTSLIPWSSGLRWGVVSSLALALGASAWWLTLPVQWWMALPTLGALASMNLLSRGRAEREGAASSPSVIARDVVIDMVAIAVVLAASGGAANPFSSLLFVYVALAASLLPARITYALAGVAALTFGALFLVPASGAACAACEAREASASFSRHLYGMWVAFALGAALIVFFLTRVRRALEDRDRALDALKQRAEDDAKFVALGTLAGGAAHELGTPLATITVLAGELEASSDAGAQETARQIRDQIERCRGVLRRMHPGTSSAPGSSQLVASVERAVETWRAAHPDAEIEVRSQEDAEVPLGPADIEAAVSVLLDNAHHATNQAASHAPIRVDAGSSRHGAFVTVTDGGAGVSPEVARRVGEPFLTTKEPGEGMGLGLYLVRKMLADVGGRLEIDSPRGGGTRVSLHVDPAVSAE